jgi:hypothetical protein
MGPTATPAETPATTTVDNPGRAEQVTVPGQAGPADEARLSLRDAIPGEHSMLDGAWWPHSRSLAHELPALISELRHRGHRVTRVSYSPHGWGTGPRLLEADGRVIRLGWFNSMDSHLLTLTDTNGGGRLDLLVVPPETAVPQAEQALAKASGPGNEGTATEVLADSTGDS